MRSHDPYDTVSAFVARLADLGVSHAVISPGSRSTPLTLCFAAQPRIRTWVQIDERAAGFFALGLGRASGRPAVLVCTSGTAAANYLPAVVEASHGGVPMIVCSADRPPELRGWGSPQTIDQAGIYGTAVRWSVDLPVPGDPGAGPEDAVVWAEQAAAAVAAPDPGPAHLNWPLREPLEPTAPLRPAEPRPARRTDSSSESSECSEPRTASDMAQLARIVAECPRGVVVAGPWPGGGLATELLWAEEARRFAAWAGWPLIGEPVAQVRSDPARRGWRQKHSKPTGVISTADHLLADQALGEALRPDAAVLVGRTVTTKPVRLWLERAQPRHVVLIDPEDRWEQAVFRLTGNVAASVEALAGITRGEPPANREQPGGWLDTWRRLDRAARGALDSAIDSCPQMLSAQTARTLMGSLPAGSVVLAANSLPVRDLDAYVFNTGSVVCSANRGAAGIDGLVSTALGIAAEDPARPVALYTGDLALLHDLSGLTAAARLGLHLLVVCADNNGGGIFSMLPVAERIPPQDFERLFRTPHDIELWDIDGFAGILAQQVSAPAQLSEAVRFCVEMRSPGVDLLIVKIDRDADVAQRRQLASAAQQAARQALAERG
ncbi:MAG: 2-succinyl-5-enolpyruvyl-6-hydroxy-3-cyclohexene-1-carboxylic-acid synthase [Acidimicrobiaceae bacterium]|nr:2-succinyl-5-enolpyruvyl-6-hydroxy-3-cyclohexene-1-carboxylic-acid synthase [Acidimicrobiaceae bacterium]MCY4279594.1 2-succinyl-5-enolpyruvyl-6-hydroxy-3-cyclohexene-1-carboxylic-acid synthase [Acidimicrobiaceae bacterium]